MFYDISVLLYVITTRTVEETSSLVLAHPGLVTDRGNRYLVTTYGVIPDRFSFIWWIYLNHSHLCLSLGYICIYM